MYDELARSQRRSLLERLVVNTLIPSVLVTFIMHSATGGGQHEGLDLSGYHLGVLLAFTPLEESWGRHPGNADFECAQSADVDDDTPVILTWTRAAQPPQLLEGRVDGCVVLEAVLDRNGQVGRINRRSIVVVSATNPLLVLPARRTLIKHFTLVCVHDGPELCGPARVRIPFEFASRGGAGGVR